MIVQLTRLARARRQLMITASDFPLAEASGFAPPPDTRRRGVGPLAIALIAAAATIIAAFISAGSPMPNSWLSTLTTPSTPLSAFPSTHAKITALADGHRTIESKLAVTIEAPPPIRDHHWYLAVQPSRQTNSYYFHKAVLNGTGGYTATVGIGPKGNAGIGTYAVSLRDVDATAEAGIMHEITHNPSHYNNFGMPLPAGALLVHTITVIRTG